MVKLKMCIFKAYANLVKLIEESVREGQKKGGGCSTLTKSGRIIFGQHIFRPTAYYPKKVSYGDLVP